MRSAIAALAILSNTLLTGEQIRVASFNIGAGFDISSGTFEFTHGVGPRGTPDHDAVAAILSRINADVVALQEIHTLDLEGDLDDLAATLGYPYVHISSLENCLDTHLRVALMSRYPLIAPTSIISTGGAREMTRNHLAVTVDVPGTERDLLIISAHLKSSTTLTDRFRRAVEMRRLVNFLNRPAFSKTENWLVLGDFNLSSTPAVFDALPANLPLGYRLGEDLAFPIRYYTNPLLYFSSRRAFRLDPRQLDGSTSTFNTREIGGPAIDLMLVSPAIAARPVFPEIYHSAFDQDHLGLPKSGIPLAASTSETASDHYAIFADLELDSTTEFSFAESGQSLRDLFDGFIGATDPQRWTTTGGSWQGTDAGSSAVTGFRSYRSGGHDGSLGALPAGGEVMASAALRNDSSIPLTVLEISLSANQWRSEEDVTHGQVSADLLVAGEVIPLPELTFKTGSSEKLTTRIRSLHVQPGADFSLRFHFTRGGAKRLPAEIFINELHYDNTGTDKDEFVEVVVGPGFSGSIANVAVYPYNGSNGKAYGNAVALSQFMLGETTASGHRIFSSPFPGLQNDREALAIVHNQSVLEFVSYEGTVTAADGPAAGLTSRDILVSQSVPGNPGLASLGLAGESGVSSGFSWERFDDSSHSPGQPNHAQTFTNLPPPRGFSIDDIEMTFVHDFDLDGSPDDEDPDDDNDRIPDDDELVFGSNPKDPRSFYQPAIQRLNAFTLRWSIPTVVGRRYTIQSSSDLKSWEESQFFDGDGSARLIDLPLVREDPHLFHRIQVEIR